MITLSSTITITPPPIRGKTFSQFIIDKIDSCVTYSNNKQSATAMIVPMGLRLPLWTKDTTPSYSEVGQFTDADVDARIKELLNFDKGNDAIVEALINLYPQPPSPTQSA